MYSIIAAVDCKLGIAKSGSIPWKCPADLKYFKNVTTGHIVVMGYRTAQSIKRKLPNRVNIVIGDIRDGNDIKANCTGSTPYDIISHIERVRKLPENKHKKVFIIGGANTYKNFLRWKVIDTVYLTTVENRHSTYAEPIDYGCDLICPYFNHIDLLDSGFKLNSSVDVLHGVNRIYKMETTNSKEKEFLTILKEILKNGDRKPNRTGVTTLGIFGASIGFDLSKSFPLMTVRPMALRMIFEELMWILRGQTDVKILEDKKVPIWTANTTQEFIDKQDLPYLAGDIGPSYGWQMRRFAQKYNSNSHNSTNLLQAGDQLKYVIDLLINNPNSRRILISLWNPMQLKEMTLPPCVWSYQFYCSSINPETNKRSLSCKIVQRSSDIALAGGWNIAGGALLVHLLASVTNMDVGSIIWSPADVHIYENQLAAAHMQVEREPRPFPQLFINSKGPADSANAALAKLLSYEWRDVRMIGYKPHKKIKIAMNA